MFRSLASLLEKWLALIHLSFTNAVLTSSSRAVVQHENHVQSARPSLIIELHGNKVVNALRLATILTMQVKYGQSRRSPTEQCQTKIFLYIESLDIVAIATITDM